MRVIELSDHPGALLQGIYQERRAAAERARSQHDDALAQHRKRVEILRDQRARARDGRRWLTWLRLSLAVRRERRRVSWLPVMAPPRTAGREAIVKAGMAGEQAVASELRAAL